MTAGGELNLGDLRQWVRDVSDAGVRDGLLALVAEVERHRADRDQPTVQGLLSGYASALAELRRRGVVRSANAPAGDYAEWLVAKALGGTLADTFSEKSWDVRLATEERVQVKTRVVSAPIRAGQLQTSPFRSWDFEIAAFVLLKAEDYTVVKAALVPVAAVTERGHWRQHVNGHVVMMNGALLGHPEATDITDGLNSAAALSDG